MLEADFLEFINNQRLFKAADRVLLAVSGGLDSMVMAEVFHRTHQPFAIAHVNFGLRGAESDADAVFVQNKAHQYAVPFHLTRFETVAVAAERGVSVQMVARDLRYAWFAELAEQQGYAAVATAHHQNDVLETLLLNLTRGTGLAGLHGIPVRQTFSLPGQDPPVRIVRPLWFATREQLTAYADAHNVTFREDASNVGDKYARNRLRHHVVPVLTQINPNLLAGLSRTVGRLRAAETLVRAELDRAWQVVAVVEGDRVLLPTDSLRGLPELAFRLTEWLRPFGFLEAQIGPMIDALDQPTGQLFTSPTHRIMHDRWSGTTAGLVLEPLPVHTDYQITLDDWPEEPLQIAGLGTLTFRRFAKPADFQPPTNSTLACFDAGRLTFPLTIRPWQLGDRFRPLGLNGTKLVSDLLNDQKVSRTERERVAVLLTGNEIAWVVGRRIGHAFRITNETKQVIEVSVSSGPG